MHKPRATVDAHAIKWVGVCATTRSGMSISDNIRQARKNQNLSRKDLAAKTGISVITLANAEDGKRTPHAKTLKLIADALGVNIDATPVAAPAALIVPAPPPVVADDGTVITITVTPQIVQALRDFGKTGLYRGQLPEDVAADILSQSVRDMLQGH